MSDLNIIKLHDRIKETSNSTGTGTVVLEGAVEGFAPFSDYVGQSGLTYYTITDSVNWEVGSGRFLDSGRNVGTFSTSQLIRFPLKSSNSNGLVNFSAGVKEVFVTHPSHAAIYSVAGLGSEYATPAKSGLAFWSSDNSLNADNDIVVDSTNTRIGINQSAPAYEIDLGGNVTKSHIRASGLIVNTSGIIFSGVNSLRQTEPFQRNQTNSTTGSNAIIFYSGSVDQILTLQKQSANNVWSGPTTGSAAYPTFRALTSSDIPSLSDTYAPRASGDEYRKNIIIVSGIAVNSSGYLRQDISATSGTFRADVVTASGSARASSFTPLNNVTATTYPTQYNYSGSAIATENVVISSSGWLTLPIFTSSSHLPPAISGHRGSVAICKFGTDEYTLVFCAPSGSTYTWFKPADASAGYIPV